MAIDLVLLIHEAAAAALGVTGSSLRPAIDEFLKRDPVKNLLKALEDELPERWPDGAPAHQADDLLRQFATLMAEPDFVGAFRDFVTDGDADALADLRRQLEAHVNVGGLAVSASEAADLIAGILRAHLAQAQSSHGSAIDVTSQFDRTVLSKQIEGSRASLERGQEDLASGIEEVAFSQQELGRQLAEFRGERMVVVQTRYASRDWAPAAADQALERLNSAAPEYLERIYEYAGHPIEAERIVSLIARPPAWANDAPREYDAALARLAEANGEWSQAVTAWERVAVRTEDESARADQFARAAVAAEVAGEADKKASLLRQARELDPAAPRLRLEEISRDTPPDEQLVVLDQLETDDSELGALIACQRSLAHLLRPDLAAAERALAEAVRLAPNAVFTRAVAINVHVQRGRLDLHQGHPLDGRALRQAWQQALELREELLPQRRFEETARLLMLACDALTISDERRRAIELLDGVRAEELTAPLGAEVLGDVALRCGAERRALELIDGAPDTEGIRRIRAAAEVFTGSSDTVLAAAQTLDDIAAGGGPEANLAALGRLAIGMTRSRVGWSDVAADQLKATGFERVAISGQALYLADIEKEYDEAVELLDPHLDEVWALAMALRVAVLRGNHLQMSRAAEALLAKAPDQVHKLECAAALAKASEFGRAEHVLRELIRDRAAPGAVRSQAYDLLMFLLGPECDRWPDAGEVYKDWQQERPGDWRASRWAPMIAKRVTA